MPAMSSPSRSLSDQQDVARLIPQVPAPVGAPPLPDRYGIPRLVLMVKDPHSLFAYWELPGVGPDHPLRLAVQFAEGGEVVGQAVGALGCCHLNVPEGGRCYRAILRDGAGQTLLVSNVVYTPPGRPSGIVDAAWPCRSALGPWFDLEPGTFSSFAVATAPGGRSSP